MNPINAPAVKLSASVLARYNAHLEANQPAPVPVAPQSIPAVLAAYYWRLLHGLPAEPIRPLPTVETPMLEKKV